MGAIISLGGGYNGKDPKSVFPELFFPNLFGECSPNCFGTSKPTEKIKNLRQSVSSYYEM